MLLINYVYVANVCAFCQRKSSQMQVDAFGKINVVMAIIFHTKNVWVEIAIVNGLLAQ